VKSWISKDANLSNDDVQDGIIPTGNFGSNQTIEGVQAASTIPANLENGNYYLIVKIDADNSIEESNEDNNIISVPFSIGCEFPCPEITRISCGFKTVSEVSGFRPINSNHPILIETDSTFEVTYDARYYNTSMNFNVEKYTLSTTGNVLSASSSPKNFDNGVKLKVEGKNLVMVISDSLTANRVNIDYQYPNPQGIIIDEKPFKTSTGYAFGIALVKDRSGEILNRVIQTDHQGGNVRVTELPNPVFYSGFKDLEEGPDGTLYTKWIAPGNYTMYVVPADGSHARSSRIATDTPSTDWIDMRPTSDSSAVYTSKTDNLNAVITKHDSKVATVQTFDLTGFIGQGSPTGARQSRINGIMPTADGGVLAGATFFDRFDTGDVGNVIGKFDSEGNMLWRLELSDKDFKVSPIGETADRGALFGGLVRKDGQAQSVVFIKTTGDGKLMPSCMQ